MYHLEQIDKYAFPYILLGKDSGLVKLHDFCDGYFDGGKLIRLYISALTGNLKISPHFREATGKAPNLAVNYPSNEGKARRYNRKIFNSHAKLKK